MIQQLKRWMYNKLPALWKSVMTGAVRIYFLSSGLNPRKNS